jgi:hypothetical protein
MPGLSLKERDAQLADSLEHIECLLRCALTEPAEVQAVLDVQSVERTQAIRQAELERELYTAQQQLKAVQERMETFKQEQHVTQQQLAAQLEIAAHQHATQADTFNKLKDDMTALQTATMASLESIYFSTIPCLDIHQAQALCSNITTIDLPLSIFQKHAINGVALLQLVDGDLQELFQLQQVGLRHRLLHCIKRAASCPAPELLQTDFKDAAYQLSTYLQQQDVDPKYRELLESARFDVLTCGDVTGDELGMVGIPFAARKPLLMLLHTANPATPLHVPKQERVQAERAALVKTSFQAPQPNVPDEYLCPITCEVMRDPVIAQDAHTYERDAISTWLASNGTSPVTRAAISSELLPVRSLQAAIQRWQQQFDQ